MSHTLLPHNPFSNESDSKQLQMTFALAKSSIYWLTEVIRSNTDWEYDEDDGLHVGCLSSRNYHRVFTYIDGALETLILLSDARWQDNIPSLVPARLFEHVEAVAADAATNREDYDPHQYLAWVHKRVLAAAQMPSGCATSEERRAVAQPRSATGTSPTARDGTTTNPSWRKIHDNNCFICTLPGGGTSRVAADQLP